MRITSLARAAAFIPLALLAGCTSSYSADIRNKTPQPLYAQVIDTSARESAIVAAVRIAPGSRAGLGPFVIATGKALLVVDSGPNPETPRQVLLNPGATTVEVRQKGDAAAGPLEILLIGP